MRILNVSQNYFVVGGMDVAMFTLERTLRDHGHEVIPFAAADAQNVETPFARYFPSAPRTEAERANGAGAVRTLYSRDARRALARLLDKHPVDLVHLHSYFKRLTPAILPELRRRRIPVVQTLHEYRSVCPISTLFRDGHICTDCAHGAYANVIWHRCAGGSLARSAWNYAEMRLSDALGHKRDIVRFVTVSDYQRDMLIEMGMEANKLVTVHHPVEVPSAPHDTEGEHVLFFGRLETAKGADLLPEIAAGLRGTSLLVAGDGSRREEVERAIAARGLSNVSFAGVLRGDALRDAIARASCVIVPSLWPEAFGLTAVEALAQGTPVVASAIGGMLDTVRDGVDGYLVPPGDVPALVARVRELLTDPTRAREMGLVGRARMATDFSADAFYAGTMRVYEDALRERA